LTDLWHFLHSSDHGKALPYGITITAFSCCCLTLLLLLLLL
jgi:hypothetical protein